MVFEFSDVVMCPKQRAALAICSVDIATFNILFRRRQPPLRGGQSKMALSGEHTKLRLSSVKCCPDNIDMEQIVSRFKKLSHTLWHCQYHIVWMAKYRLRILEGRCGFPL